MYLGAFSDRGEVIEMRPGNLFAAFKPPHPNPPGGSTGKRWLR
jgi:hypothetical protein